MVTVRRALSWFLGPAGLVPAARIPQALFALLLATVASGCASVDRGLYDASSSAAPPHPVTGKPVFNIVSEEDEIATAQKVRERVAEAAASEGIPFDANSPRFDELNSVFERITSVAHRQHLPWEVHLIGDPTVNAFTAGGGVVFVHDGLYGGLVYEGDVDELAAVMAHEVAHVTLLHASERRTWQGVVGIATKKVRDPYFNASFTTEQEAEADKLAALYMALAGYDPLAASRVWARAHSRSGSDAGAGWFLNSHPVDLARMAATEKHGRAVRQFF